MSIVSEETTVDACHAAFVVYVVTKLRDRPLKQHDALREICGVKSVEYVGGMENPTGHVVHEFRVVMQRNLTALEVVGAYLHVRSIVSPP